MCGAGRAQASEARSSKCWEAGKNRKREDEGMLEQELSENWLTGRSLQHSRAALVHERDCHIRRARSRGPGGHTTNTKKKAKQAKQKAKREQEEEEGEEENV